MGTSSGPTGITQRIALSADRHGGRYDSLNKGATSVNTQPPAVAPSLVQQQVVASNVGVFSINLPAIDVASSVDVPYSNALGIASFVLARGATGLVIVAIDLVAQPTGDVIVVFSKQLSYGGVAPNNTWTLPSGVAWAGGQVSGVARAFSLAGSAAQTLEVLCTSLVLGSPSQGGS